MPYKALNRLLRIELTLMRRAGSPHSATTRPRSTTTILAGGSVPKYFRASSSFELDQPNSCGLIFSHAAAGETGRGVCASVVPDVKTHSTNANVPKGFHMLADLEFIS